MHLLVLAPERRPRARAPSAADAAALELERLALALAAHDPDARWRAATRWSRTAPASRDLAAAARAAGEVCGCASTTARSRRGWTVTGASERTYETAVARIEEIIRRLDSGEAGLRETLDLVKEGRELVEYCAAELEAVSRGLEELRLEELVARLEARSRRS